MTSLLISLPVSGSTGYAVLNHNLNSVNSSLRYILIQWPELLDSKKPLQRVSSEFLESIGKQRILQITKERMRRLLRKSRRKIPITKVIWDSRYSNWIHQTSSSGMADLKISRKASRTMSTKSRMVGHQWISCMKLC